jgi:hypothetical protein
VVAPNRAARVSSFRTTFAATVFTVLLVPSFAYANGYDANYEAGYYDGAGDAEFDQWLKEDEQRNRREDKLMGLRSYTDPDDVTSYTDPDVTNFHHRLAPPPPANFHPQPSNYSVVVGPRPVDIVPELHEQEML